MTGRRRVEGNRHKGYNKDNVIGAPYEKMDYKVTIAPKDPSQSNGKDKLNKRIKG